MIIIYVALALAAAGVTIYFVTKSKEFLFLAGAFFTSGGIQFYLYLAHVSVPLLGTNLVFTPEISGLRCIPHFIFSALCVYFGFIKKSKDNAGL